MKNVYFLILAFFLFINNLIAQKQPHAIRFKNGDFIGNRNLQKGKLTKEFLAGSQYHNKIYTIIQFEKTPDDAERKDLAAVGIRLFDYIPGNAFMAEMPDSFSTDELKKNHAAGVYAIERQLKISPRLEAAIHESVNDKHHLIAVSYFGSLSKNDVIKQLENSGGQIVHTKIQPGHIIFITASMRALNKIAALPFVSYINEQILNDTPLNYNNHAIHSLDALGAFSGRNLQGNNVTVGVGDNADPSSHIDFTGRLIDRNPNWTASHGTHTTGTTGGGGILNPKYKGMAPMSTLVSQSYSDILVNAPVYINDYSMILTNNSYYSGANGCPGEGEYDALSNYVDAQIFQYDSLLHVFASGNDGLLACTPYPTSFATVKSGFQCGKNVVTVGAISNVTYKIASFSSSGPVNDGRIKPEIVAGGANITSTFAYNTYGLDNGTSMAAPTVTGTLALLYQRYRQLHSGSNPSSALIKAIACNSADDLGNPGPDYTYGFGMLNARTAVETIEKNQYFSGTINNSAKATYSINSLPSGVQQLKIMLYWNDPAASVNAAISLVNNLDLTVTEPNGTITHHPLTLNPNAGHVSDNAAEGIDSINNIEQVVINNPPAGNFTITVNGTSIPSGPQNYVVAYQIINPSVTVEYPFGSETWVPGETENIRWSAYGGDPNTFTLEYSTNDGSTWNTISNNIVSTARSYAWTVPGTATNQALIRVTRNTVNYSDTSDYVFTILGQPVITLSNPCQGYAQLVWNTISSATGYEIMMLKGDSMQTIAATTDTSYLLKGLSRDSSYWLTVRAINGITAGRRAIAANVIPASNSVCAFTGNDFTIDSLIAPLTGRQHTSSQLSNSASIKIELKNLGTLASSGTFPVSYQVNGGSIVTENISASIASNTVYAYTFTAPYDFSNAGVYTIKAWVGYPADTLHENDTLTTTIKNLQNDTISLSPNFIEGFENTAAGTYYNNTHGFTGLDRCDFFTSNSNGRARTFINTGFARTGNRCATLDQVLWSNASTADSLITTFNLSNYSSGDQIWLNFYYRNQGINFSLPGNTVWIRGNDQAAWIPVDTLSILGSSIGTYLPSNNIDVTGILSSAVPAQTISSSFQIKFGEQGYYSANSVITDGAIDNGYSFDDITITKATNDVGMLSLISPGINGICNLSNAEVVTVKVKNYSSNTLNNIAVSYSINGSIVTENIPTLAPYDTLVYAFTHTADLSAYQNYLLSVWVNYSGDNYHSNDSLSNINFNTTPIISSYPYLEGFENSNGYWYTNGVNDNWQWGIPSKTIINKAANGSKAWVTSLTGNYSDNQLSYLYSPCFDLSTLAHPVLSFSHIFQTEDDCDCDYHWAEYSTDGINWIKLGAVGSGTNWYDNATKQGWQKSDTIWHVSSIDVPTNASKVRFRIVMFSDPATNYEGVGIDDIHLFDKAPVYSGFNIDSGITQTVSGNNWVNFSVKGNMVASINPNGQDLGNTTVKAYIYDSSTRYVSNQYYLNRNIVIQPSNQPTDSVSVRFYFLGSETESMIAATGCATCTNIHDAYQSGITKYSNDAAHEDSTLSNNAAGTYSFILPHSQVSIIPNDNGYYAEYKVAGFSEFWINGGGINQNQPLALVLQSFTATKLNSSQALLQWSVVAGSKTNKFIIEKSTDSISFTDIDSVSYINGTNNYQYTDSLISGVNYYRLLIIDSSGNFQYSQVRSVTKDANVTTILVYPNPVESRILYVKTPVNCRSIQLCDLLGRIIITENTSGIYNTLPMPNVSTGIYFVTVETDNDKQVKKIFVR